MDSSQTKKRGPSVGRSSIRAVREVMDIEEVVEAGSVYHFRGQLLVPPNIALEQLRHHVGTKATSLIREDLSNGTVITVVPEQVERKVLERRDHPFINVLLLVATVLTTTWAGARHLGVDLLRDPSQYAVGLPYAAALLGILGVHELGHYFMAKKHKMRVSLPYFIPAPFALGTLGAFINMKSPPADRRSMFDVAIAGPLAGLLVALPALYVGFQISDVYSAHTLTTELHRNAMSPMSSLLFGMVGYLAIGKEALGNNLVHLSPLAYAGWLGLFVTALNLLPVGQLDGGHITRGMCGSRIANIVSFIVMWSLFLLAVFVVPALMTWVVIVFLLGGKGTSPLNDVTPLSMGRKLLGLLAFIIFVSILVPMPASLLELLE